MTAEVGFEQPGERWFGKLTGIATMRLVGPVLTAGLAIGLWYLAGEVLMSEGRKFLVPPPTRSSRSPSSTREFAANSLKGS